jgi:hypothetical protein
VRLCGQISTPPYTFSVPSSCAVQNQEENAAPHLHSTKTASHTAPHISYLLQIPHVVAAVLAAHRVVQDYQPDRLDVHHGRCRDRQMLTGLAYPHYHRPASSTPLCKHALTAKIIVAPAVSATLLTQREYGQMHAAKRQNGEHSDINRLTGHRHHKANEVHSVPGPCMSGIICRVMVQARGIQAGARQMPRSYRAKHSAKAQ